MDSIPQRQDRSPACNALTAIRAVWAVFAFSQIALLVVVLVARRRGVADVADADLAALFRINVGLLVVLVPLGGFLRAQIYKRHWRGDAIAAQGYVGGNLLLLSALECTCLFGLVILLLSGDPVPAIVPPLLAMACHVVNFPTGAPLRKAQPEFCAGSAS